MNDKQLEARILIVDDRPDKAESLAALVSDLGQLVIVHSGKDALRCLLNDEFAVIMLDVNMPGMDGFETASLIRQRASFERTPIIFITAYNNTDTHVTRGYSLGAVDYIFAPPVPEILRAKVAVFVDLHRKTIEVRRRATERIQLVQEQTARVLAEENEQRASILAEASKLLASSFEPQSVLKQIAELLIPRYGSICGMDLYDDAGALKRMVHHPADGFQFPLPGFKDSKLSDQVLIIPDLSTATSIPSGPGPEWIQELVRGGILSLIIAPVSTGHGNAGFLILARKAGEPPYASAERILVEDLAHRIATALEHARLYREAQDANRLKDEFLAAVSHELRTPLTPILGWLRILNSSKTNPEMLSRGMEVVERNVKAQVKLIDDLLDVSRIVTGKLRLNICPVDVRLLVNNAMESMKLTANTKRISLQASIADNVQIIHVDPERIEQVLWNLINNAIKFTPNDGKVRLEVTCENENVRFRVTDNGKGIKPQFLPYVFDRFRQADGSFARKEGGLGLGLSIVRHLVDLHGGTAEAASAGEGTGSSFTISLPGKACRNAPDSKPVAMEHADVETCTINLASHHILLIDDEQDAREMVSQLLSVAGANVQAASTAEEALRILNHQPFDLIISDLSMPGIDGFEFLRRVRHQMSIATPALAFSALCRPEDVSHALEAGFQQHLSKPVDPNKLIKLVSAILLQPERVRNN